MKLEYSLVENIGVIPCIEMTNRDLRAVHSLFIKNIFNKGGKGYTTNEKHLVQFNDNLIITWINNKDFIHMIMDDRHYRIDLKKNDLVVADSYYYNMKNIIKNDCINFNNKTNIYQ